METLNNYKSIKRILSGITDGSSTEHLVRLINSRIILPIDEYIDINNVNKNEFDRIVGLHVNAKRGFEYMFSRKNESRQNASEEYSKYSIEIDIYNLLLSVYFNKKLSKDNDTFCIMTTHGLYTLFGWREAVKNKRNRLFEH